MPRFAPTAAVAAVLALSACQSQPEQIQAVNDQMSCAEVADVIDAAIERGTTYVSLEQSNEFLAADLVFVLSGTEERSECVSEAVRSRANGLRATINGSWPSSETDSTVRTPPPSPSTQPNLGIDRREGADGFHSAPEQLSAVPSRLW